MLRTGMLEIIDLDTGLSYLVTVEDFLKRWGL